MAKDNKTQYTDVSVKDFIDSVPVEQRRMDASELVKIYEEVTGFKPKMYGPSIIGFGNYHYVYASGREGDAPLAAFSPRKDSIVFYFEDKFPERERLLDQLGPYKAGKVCVYIKKLEDVDQGVVRKLIKASMKKTQETYG